MCNLAQHGQMWLPTVAQAEREVHEARAVVDALIDALVPVIDQRQRNSLSDAVSAYRSAVELDAAARLMVVVQVLCSTDPRQPDVFVPAPLAREGAS
jgi:hypothetical protein